MSRISVITSCHNSAKFIHRLLDSVLEQTYPNVEMILVDNASQADTVDVINSYVSKFKKKGYVIKCISQDLGPSAGIQANLKEGFNLIYNLNVTAPVQSVIS